MCWNWVEKKNGETAILGNSMILKEGSIADKLRGRNPVKKIVLRGSAGLFPPVFFFVGGGGGLNTLRSFSISVLPEDAYR